jgi:hypothetical protein
VEASEVKSKTLASESPEQVTTATALALPPESRPTISPAAAGSCPTCSNGSGTAYFSYIYALGRIEPRCPSLAVEKEFAQATGRADAKGLTDRQALHATLTKPENWYLARQLCYVFSVQGLETYILRPRDPRDFDLLVDAVRAEPAPGDMDVIVGVRGPIAGPEACNGLMVPIVGVDNIYSFSRDQLIGSIPRPDNIPADKFRPVAEEIFDRGTQLADNAGATDEHRAVNYLAVRYPAIYATAADAFARNLSLSAVETRPSALSGTRKIVEVIFAFTHRQTDVTEKFFVRVDVTEEWPFLVTKMSPYYDR